MEISDQEILELIKTDANAGFKLLLKQYQQPVYFHIRQMLYNHDDTDDVTQNVFIKVYKNIANFKGESKLFTWIYRIATNEALNFLQQKARKNNIPYEDVAYEMSQNLEADVHYDGDEIMLKLEKAVAQLPEKQRLVFQMKYFEEMKYQDIAEITNTSVGSLKASYHHAVKKVEEFLLPD
ncbi:RNA polymerase sigma factor [Weeksellaceae bacterium KMM 9713]|uniref:RNA polymerase sigma factor n=1 Tax=Profundicola chukchiensis TaxID=2961959 RepID=A0A9X4MVZ4_9FLAO|nr:RNA polymerase sigma factor [Profundicola chukchiensis]MDG4945891.1 RNA polymerase sigma factor [Profundicola chukchiensis]